MDEENRLDLINEFKNKKKFDLIILTSYIFDALFFDNYLEQILRKNNPYAKIYVLVDAKKYVSDPENFTSITNRDYNLIYIPLKKTFHPKIFLFCKTNNLFKSELYICSSNLTLPGITKNLELICKIKKNPNHIYSALIFFNDLIEKKIILNNQFKESINFLNKINKIDLINDKIFFNSNDTILSQLLSEIEINEVDEILIASPFFTPNNNLFKILNKKLNPKKIKLAIQLNNNNLKKETFENIPNLELYSINLNESRRIHFKIIYIKSKNQEYLLTGSANFTESALNQNISCGNCEASIFLKGNYFSKMIDFLNLKPLNKKDFKENDEEDYINVKKEFLIVYNAEIDEFNNILNIDIKTNLNSNIVKVYINESKDFIESKINNEKIIIKIDNKKIDNFFIEIDNFKSNVYRLFIPNKKSLGIDYNQFKKEPKKLLNEFMKNPSLDVFEMLYSIFYNLNVNEEKSLISNNNNETNKNENINLSKSIKSKNNFNELEKLINYISNFKNPNNSEILNKKDNFKSHTYNKDYKENNENSNSNISFEESTEKIMTKLNNLFINILISEKSTSNFLSNQLTFIIIISKILHKNYFLKKSNLLYKLLRILEQNINDFSFENKFDEEVFESFISYVYFIKLIIYKNDSKIIRVLDNLSKISNYDLCFKKMNILILKINNLSEIYNMNFNKDFIKDHLIIELSKDYFIASNNKKDMINDLFMNLDNFDDKKILSLSKILNQIKLYSNNDILKLISLKLDEIISKEKLSKFSTNEIENIKDSLKDL